MINDKLTAKEQRFVDEYIICLNGTEACSRAGYAGDRAVLAVTASRLLRKPKIIHAIQERLDAKAMPSNEVLSQLTEISRNDMGDLLNSFGGIDISEAMRRGKTNQIKRFKSKVTTITEKDGTEREIIETEIELYDRQAALNTLAKYHDLTNKVIVEDWRTEFIALLREGKLQPIEVQEEFGIEVANELFLAAGIPSIMSSKTAISPQSYAQARAEQARRFINRVTPRYYEGDDPVEFINREMVIPETGKPLILHPEQADVLRAMSHKTDGLYDYSMWLYSAPKKSGKTTVAAGVALWQAIQVPDGQVYIIGNDLKQADNRMMEAIRYAINHNPRFKNRARIVRNTIYLDNGTKLESIPVDPKGEAGMNPTGLFWTEAWGAMGNKPELLWSEAVLSPTRAGKSFKFVESYAGFEGESLILERLYKSIIKGGAPHATIPELFTKGSSVGYWCTRRYMSWQQDNPEYYAQEAADKTPQEYARVHGNEWSSSSEAFIPVQWWDNCKVDNMLPLNKQGVIIGIDAAVENDCFAVVVVSVGSGKPQVRYCQVWKPSKGSPINFADIEAELIRLFKAYNVVEVAYDPYQMASMAQRLQGLVFWKAFTQGAPRLVSDKRLYDMIRDRQIEHAGEYADLRQHIINADRKPEEDKMRIIKRNQDGKIDAVVALSMAVDRIMHYNL